MYKLASGSIAERLRYTLDNIISICQTGFIKGRFLSDSIRLIYILQVTEKENIPRLLMSTPFRNITIMKTNIFSQCIHLLTVNEFC